MPKPGAYNVGGGSLDFTKATMGGFPSANEALWDWAGTGPYTYGVSW
jgi:hypothetical protein